MSDAGREFPETAKKDWILAAAKELNDKDPIVRLSHKAGELTILPYYDASDLPTKYQTSTVGHGKPWVNAPKVIVDESVTANSVALRHLEAGANGVLFDIRTFSPEPEVLLAGIELEFCSIFFNGNVTADFMQKFALYATRKFNASKVSGAAYGLSIHDFGQLRSQFAPFSQFKTLGLELGTPSLDSTSLARAFLETQARLAHGKESPRCEPLALLVDLSDDFFSEIIRLRAVEMIWTCFTAAYQQTAELFIHCQSKPLEDPSLQPHGNMIAATTRAISALIGGAKALTINPEAPHSLETRIARNISFILQDESHLGRANNLSEGSYFIEAVAHELAEKAWSLFKEGV